MMIRKTQILAVLLVVVIGFMADAQASSFSELNESRFQSLSKGGTPGGWKDPFAAGASNAQELVIEDLQLMGVVVGIDKSYALISGFVVEKGDIIAGFKVHTISRENVVLKRLDEVYVLSMGGGL
jgi:hypothetical protein